MSVSCGVGMGDALHQLPKEDLAGAVLVLRAPEASAVRGMCGRAAHNHHCYLARIRVDSHRMGRYCAEMVRLVGGHEDEG